MGEKGERRGERSDEYGKHSEDSVQAGQSNNGESVKGVLQVYRRGKRGLRYRLGIQPKPLVVDDALDGDSLAIVIGKQRDSSPPKITFIEECKKSIWRLKGSYDILEVGFGYFLVKCDLAEDRDKVKPVDLG
ncbi:hypothetical protein PIB30_077767 [Stylosanthes scabra]|uniref:Uncharacterized protein n=1 Tax=Stylosanthes scabra TaxID=79078 RepID=A0ABU6VQH5_9FABA|nr:hypothetical protein [Stylosanthes scabra]